MPSIKKRERGYTLVELLIAMALALIVLTSLSSAFVSQHKTFDAQEQAAEMVQGARAAMDMICAELRMAGYDPTGAGIVGVPYSATQLQILADIDDDDATGVGDGDTGDTHENIIYTYDGANKQIDRDTGSGGQPFAENIEAFTFQYYDGDLNVTTNSADIRQIDISITSRTSKPDPDGGYRTYTLNSYVTPPNLGF